MIRLDGTPSRYRSSWGMGPTLTPRYRSALSPAGSRPAEPAAPLRGQHERPREEVSNVGFVSALFSRTGLLIAIYIVIGVFVNTAPPHVPTGGANLLSLHSWVQYFIS